MLEEKTEEHSQARLKDSEQKKVDAVTRFRSPVIYEVIRRQGQEELHRPLISLATAGVAAGVVMGFSVLGQALLKAHLPDAPWTPMVVHLGYSVGFLIVIMSRLQLFTENTITAVLPICAYPTRRNFLAVARLWSIVLAGNVVGTLIFSAFIRFSDALPAEHFAAFVAVCEGALQLSPTHALAGGVVSGFLIACLVWVAPIVQAAEFWMVLMVTYVIALGGFSHVVVGSAEAWFLVLNGSAGAGRVAIFYVLPALCGNIIGGTGLFTLLAYTQVFTELDDVGQANDESEALACSGRQEQDAVAQERPSASRADNAP